MMPSYIGDTWVFDLAATDLAECSQSSNYVTVGTVPAGEYVLMLSGRLEWQDPEGDPMLRTISPALDLDGFDAQGAEPPGWNGSGIYIRAPEQYLTINQATHSRNFAEHSVVSVPDGTILKLQVCHQGPSQPTPIRLAVARLIALRVDPQNGVYGA